MPDREERIAAIARALMQADPRPEPWDSHDRAKRFERHRETARQFVAARPSEGKP